MSSAARTRALRWRPDGATVLDDVELDVTLGTICGVLGPNGSGKTTLLRCLARLLRPDGGAVELDGEDVARLAQRELGRRVAVVGQEQPGELELSALDVALIGRTPHKRRFEPDTAADERLAARALDSLGVGALALRRVATLSGGERQRVSIARALVQDTPLLVLDEPTNHLDLRHQHELFALLRRSGTTVVASLHDLQLAASYCDTVVVLDRGRVVAAGEPAATLTPGLLAAVWGIEADVSAGADGRALVRVVGPLA